MPSLLTAPTDQIEYRLRSLVKNIPQIFPLRKQHRQELQYAVKDLSRLLTTERSQKQAYWSAPRLLGAYLYYFLPWNLLRLSMLLPNLPLKINAGDRLLDLGSGPMTFHLGLWLSRPDLAGKELALLASDLAPRPMELGRQLLDLLQGADSGKKQLKKKYDEDSALLEYEIQEAANANQTKQFQPRLWNARLLRAPFDLALRKAGGRVNFISAANVFNELSMPRYESMEESMADIFTALDRALLPGGQILLIEPGTRLGGKIVATQRKMALEMGYKVLSPCPHHLACPLLSSEQAFAESKSKQSGEGRFVGRDSYLSSGEDRIAGSRAGGLKGRVHKENVVPRQYGTGVGSWCHFSQTAVGAPEELRALSYAAGLDKEKLHLSFVLLEKPDFKNNAERQQEAGSSSAQSLPAQILQARVLSDPIKVPGSTSPARYVCTSLGLGLLQKAKDYPSGHELMVKVENKGKRDPKTGALEMTLAQI